MSGNILQQLVPTLQKVIRKHNQEDGTGSVNWNQDGGQRSEAIVFSDAHALWRGEFILGGTTSGLATAVSCVSASRCDE